MDLAYAIMLTKSKYEEETTGDLVPFSDEYRDAVKRCPVVMAAAFHVWAQGLTKKPGT
jgi:hypothetical protein